MRAGTLAPGPRAITATGADADELGHVDNAVWVRWIQYVAVAHWMAVAPRDHVASYVWVVTRHEIDCRGSVEPRETVTATTWIDEAPRGARFDRLMEFHGADGKLRVAARTTWAMLDNASGRIMRVPKEVAAPFLR